MLFQAYRKFQCINIQKASEFTNSAYSGCTSQILLEINTELTSLSFLQTAEAEMTSLNQQRKIDELEAQLNEAEDVIADLRTEVKHVWDKLEKVKRSQAKALNGRIRKEDASSREITAAQLMIPPPPSSSASETVTTSDLKNAPLDQKSKEPEPYINGFTQRIHACERNLPDGIVPTSGDVGDQHSPKKNELTTKMIHKEEGKCPVPSTRTIIMKIMKNSTREEVKKPVKVRTSRRRNRFGKVKANLRKSRPGHLMKPCQQSSILSSGKPHSINGLVKSAEGACTIPSIKADKEEFKTVNKREGKNEMKRGDAIDTIKSLPDQLSKPCQSFSVLSCCRTFSHSVNGNVKSGEDRLKINEIESKVKPLTRLDPGLTLIKRDINPRLGSTNLTVSMKATKKSGLIQNAVEDTKMDDSELGKHKGDTADNLTHPSPELNVGMVKIRLMNSDLKDAEASDDTKDSSCQSDNNRLLKYTFQRKRKKESLGNLDESVPLEKRRAGENQSGAPELQGSSLNNESSRDGRRLAQVARQLVSLSGKRWW